ncbi:MAG: hypothetical protein HRU35_00255 [Rickettsiaceae bacterium]|nr:hypothetical protein [Rickettsiaceae bacterium]
MAFDIDIVIFVIFVILTLVIGVFSSRGVTNINQFALGGRNFSTMALSATIIASWIGGSVFLVGMSETYKNGLHFVIPLLGDFFVFLVIGLVLVPRMKEFLGKLSVAEAMGSIYGQQPRLIIAIMGVFVCSGVIAIQFKVSSTMMELLFGVSSFNATLISAVVVVFYSTFGGIRAVTFTDILQFFAFSIVIPIVTFTIWQSFGDHSLVFNSIANNPIFDYKNVFDYQHPRFFINISLLFYFFIPHMNPALFQRISMSNNTNQGVKAFIIAGVLCIIIELLICWIGVLLFATNPNLEPDNLFSSLLNNYSNVGFKGFVIAGVMAMIMSSSDSFINSSSVMFAHDCCNNLNLIKTKHELLLSRAFSIIVGVLGFIVALNAKTVLSLLIMTWGFYNSIVTVPLLFAIFGFRSSTKSFLIATISSITIFIVWEMYFIDSGIDSVVPGILTNLITLFGSHYLLKQPGGWVGIKDGGQFAELQAEKKIRWKKRIKAFKEFNFIKFCLRNKPENEVTYPLFALFAIISTYSAMFEIDETIRSANADILDKIFHSVIIFSSMFLTYPIWPASLKSDKFIGVAWNIGLFYILIFASSLQVIFSSFNNLHIMIFMINIMILGLLSRWYVALFMSITGVFLSIQFFKLHFSVDQLPGSIGSMKFQLVYGLLLTASALIVFIKPKQEQFSTTKAKVTSLEKENNFIRNEVRHLAEGVEYFDNELKTKEHTHKEKTKYLRDKINLMNIEIEKLQDMKDEFLRNMPHECNAPLTGILSLSDALYSSYDSLDKTTIKDSIKNIVNSGDLLKTYIHNMIDLSKLTSLSYELKKREINLSELVKTRPYLYKKIFSDDEKQEFKFDVEDNIVVDADEYFLTQAIDNLISNAVKYGEGKQITLSLKKVGDKIQFKIIDQGIGIPENELHNIFSKFITSSRTKTRAGGRGIGLALVQKIIEAHKGEIWVKNNEEKGATFYFVI